MGLRAPRRWRRTALPSVAAAACLAAGGGLLVHVHAYQAHSRAAGRALVHTAAAHLAEHRAAPTAGCDAGPPSLSSGALYGVLRVPGLGLTAPIVQGVAEAQLSVAVGHLPASVWPGDPGTSVLAAHDVTWFARIASLQIGDTFTVQAGCRQQTYRVTGQQVVAKGSPLRQDAQPRVVLETCWPTDALYWTNQRFLVFASLVATRESAPLRPPAVSAANPYLDPRVAAAAAATPEFPQGTLTVDGVPDPVWSQSNAPLLVARAAIAEVQAGLAAVANRAAGAWEQLAPGVPLPPHSASSLASGDRIDITEEVSGTAVRAVSAVVQAPNAAAVAVRLGLTDGKLRVLAW